MIDTSAARTALPSTGDGVKIADRATRPSPSPVTSRISATHRRSPISGFFRMYTTKSMDDAISAWVTSKARCSCWAA